MRVVSRSEAKAGGLKRYFTGKPCPAGHVSARVTADKSCVGCWAVKRKKYRQRNLERVRELCRATYYRTRAARLAYARRRYRQHCDEIKKDMHRRYLENRAMILAMRALLGAETEMRT